MKCHKCGANITIISREPNPDVQLEPVELAYQIQYLMREGFEFRCDELGSAIRYVVRFQEGGDYYEWGADNLSRAIQIAHVKRLDLQLTARHASRPKLWNEGKQ